MKEYLVKVGFWLRAYDSVTIEASTDEKAVEKARHAAKALMESRAHPESIDRDERREGGIICVDRLAAGGRNEVAGYVPFDDDRIHPSLHDFVKRIAALPTNGEARKAGNAEAIRQYHALIGEARTLLDRGA